MSSPRATFHGVRSLSLACIMCALVGCTRTTNLASSQRPVGPGRDAGTARDAAPDARPPVIFSDAGVVLCDGVPCACNNGLDDDSDGLIDGFDGECTGPYDQDERTFATGEGPQGNPNCRDCYFDGNPSASDDNCRIATVCLTEGNSNNAPGACATCEPSTQCVDSCLPRTPNGCDCFGCCEIEKEGFAILLVDSCSLDVIDDSDKCPRCQVSTECRNTCGQCELCPGRTLADLPPACDTGMGPAFTCEGAQSCDADRPCEPGAYCAQGCCLPIAL